MPGKWRGYLAYVILLCSIGLAGCGYIRYAYRFDHIPDSVPASAPSWGVEAKVAFAPEGVNVAITNNGNEPISVLWDECIYIDPNNISHRVLTSQTRLITSQLAQTPTPIAPGSSIEESLLPADYVSSYVVKSLFPVSPGGEWASGYKAPANSLIGKEVGLLLALERNGEKWRQKFRFKVTDVNP